MRTKVTADDRLCFLLQKLIILGAVGFFCLFSGWILLYIARGDPFSRVLGPVIIGLLLSIATFAFWRGVWPVAKEGWEITKARSRTPERRATDYTVTARRYEVSAGADLEAASGLKTASWTPTTKLAATAWTPGRGVGTQVQREGEPIE